MLENEKSILAALPFSDSGSVLIWTAKPKKSEGESDGKEEGKDESPLKKEELAKVLKDDERFEVVALSSLKPKEGGIIEKPVPVPGEEKKGDDGSETPAKDASKKVKLGAEPNGTR